MVKSIIVGVIAILLLTIAHIIRVYRWGLFISVYEKPDRKRLMRAITLGYLANYIVPFKLGDILRAFFAGRKMKTGKALAFSTVIVERIMDVIVVGTVFLALAIQGNPEGRDAAKFYIISAAAVILVVVMAFLLRAFVKKGVVLFARIFNTRLEGSVLVFCFSLISDFKNMLHRISILKLILSTIAMWGTYIASYYAFARYISFTSGEVTTWVDVFVNLFSQSSIVSNTGRVSFFWQQEAATPIEIFAFLFIPLVLLWIVSFFYKTQTMDYEDADSHFIKLLPQLDFSERLTFLENYFSNNNKKYIDSYLQLNRDIAIIRDYSAGSNATTMLCMDGNKTFFRKYAFGKDGDKLYDQVRWIESNTGRLPLPEIIKHSKTETYCFYDMPYDSHSVGLFEYVHSMPIQSGWAIIRQALESMENSLYKIDVKPADSDTIDAYITEKVEKNLEKIRKAKYISGLQKYEKIVINGVEYDNLEAYNKYLDREYLRGIFENDSYSVIHGDLTVENIICTRGDDGKDDFYIIDPNTGNLHESPNLDYGKLLQSIHGGYEFLMSTKDVSIHGNRIDFLFTGSSVYKDLHSKLKEYMLDNFGLERTRSVYFHEIIHWLRLMPYKIEKDEKRAVLFYAGMLIVMNDVIKMFADSAENV